MSKLMELVERFSESEFISHTDEICPACQETWLDLVTGCDVEKALSCPRCGLHVSALGNLVATNGGFNPIPLRRIHQLLGPNRLRAEFQEYFIRLRESMGLPPLEETEDCNEPEF